MKGELEGMRSIIQHTFAEELKNQSNEHTFMQQSQQPTFNQQHMAGMSLACHTIDQENMIAVDDEDEEDQEQDPRENEEEQQFNDDMAAQDLNR